MNLAGFGAFGGSALAAPDLTVSATPNVVEVSEGAGQAHFDLQLNAPADSDVRVKYESREGTADHSATIDEDFASVRAWATIPAGKSEVSVQVPVHNDNRDEGVERFQLFLVRAENAAIANRVGHVNISDSTPRSDSDGTQGAVTPGVYFEPVTVEAREADGEAILTVTLDSATEQAVNIEYETREGNADNAATPDEDFAMVSGSLTIPAGEISGTLSVPVLEDAIKEGKERLQIHLLRAENATVARRVGHVVIADTSATPEPEPEESLVKPGPYAYLNDVDPRNNTPSPWQLEDVGYPRIGLADSPTQHPPAALTKYHMVASQNPFTGQAIQSITDEAIFLRQVNPFEYQETVRQALPFTATGSRSEGHVNANGIHQFTMFPGHWIYQASTRLSEDVDVQGDTIVVSDPSVFSDEIAGRYIIIHDGEWGNAEHIKIKSIKGNKLTVAQRGFRSRKYAHRAGAVVAEHATGGGRRVNALNWLYNQSTACPTDANGRTFSDVLVAWLAENYAHGYENNTWTRAQVRVDGLQFDTDRYYMLRKYKVDVDNDGKQDDGFDGKGYNMWGEGMEQFYADLRRALPDMLIVGGGTGARGFDSISGIQHEGYPVEGGSFSTTPNYEEVEAHLANFGFHIRHHNNKRAALTHALNKSSTKLYTLDPRVGGKLNLPSNAPFRFSFGMALLEDGFYGQPSSGPNAYKELNDAWWDEYAVDVEPGSPTFGEAILSEPFDDANQKLVRQHTGWMGKPLGERVRYYDSAQFAPESSLLSVFFDDANELSEWEGEHVDIHQSDSAFEGEGALRISKHKRLAPRGGDAKVLGPFLRDQNGNDLKEGEYYTLVFAIKASEKREVSVAVRNGGAQAYWVPTEWSRRVMTFQAGPRNRLKFLVGSDDAEVWLDSIRVFKGNAGVFQRDFENARVVVNATAEEVRDIELGGTFRRIRGTQDPEVNDGSTVKRVTLPPYDAAILIRE